MSKLSRNMRKIRKMYRRSRASEKTQEGVFEWLLDNYYLYEREGRRAMAESRLVRRFIKQGKLTDDGKRVSDLCDEIVSHRMSVSDEKTIEKIKDSVLTTWETEIFTQVYRASLFMTVTDAVIDGDSRENRDTVSYATNELRVLRNLDVYGFEERISPLDEKLAAEPAGLYSRMTAGTRAEYRRRIAELARREGTDETVFLSECLRLAREENKHVGEYLDFCDGKNQAAAVRVGLLVSLIPLSAAVLCICTYLFSGSAVLATAAFLPLWAFVYKIFSFFEARTKSSSFVLRMKKDDLAVKSSKVMIVIPILMPRKNELDALHDHLIDIFSSYEKNENVRICVLADFSPSKNEKNDGDSETAKAFGTLICDLNQKYGNSFLGLVRKRSYSKTQREFIGRDRKRGAICDLTNFILKSGDFDSTFDFSPFIDVYGNTNGISDTEYLMILDGDTELPFDTLSEMVACAVHPINKEKYGVFSPVTKTALPIRGMTRFTKLFSGAKGAGSYSGPTKELTQDLFGTSLFCGKGLIDCKAFYEKAVGAFKEETVLSHDILEGELLQTLYVSDTEIAEGFPETEISYFKRLDRWVRGDIQNIVFLFSNSENGMKFTGVSKYKIAENIRRAVTPVMSVLTLILGSVTSPLIASVIVLLSLDSLSEIFLLGQRAYVCFRATVKGLARRFITHRNILSWTTAAGCEGLDNKKLLKNFLFFLPGTLIGILLLLLPGITKVFGVFFILNTIFAYFTAKPFENHEDIAFSKQAQLYKYAKDAWHYYESFVGKTDNYLPPDNMQETPVYRIAHRTSPTNIGLFMLCTLAACDFGFINAEEMCRRLGNTLNTVMRLEKYRGNLYNWYDTKTLEILNPAYISTVDSGNFVCMLTALKEGLYEYAQSSDVDNVTVSGLISAVDKIIDDTDLSFLYDSDAKLFRIGYSVADDTFSTSYYDLLMSEARMTGYYAVAKRQAPKEHMEKLSRVMTGSGRHKGPVSWTGTMFEYYLPHLLLPVYEDSMSEHALKFCEYWQKRYADDLGIPFGMSESGFYSFDRQLSYQYKAHGVQKLGLKRSLDRDRVVSPYSTFLLLPYNPEFAFSNLERLSGMGAEGKCGFYEAVDFTPDRVGEQDYMIVRSFMAHHVGMSLISLSNAAFNGIMQKRFMSDLSMRGAKYLLTEGFPKNPRVFRDIELVPEKKKDEHIHGAVKRVEGTGSFANYGRVFTNGEWTQIVFSNGMTRSLYRGMDMTVPPSSSFDTFAGVRLFAEECNKRHEILPSKVVYRDTNMTFISHHKGVAFTHTTGTHPRFCGETHVFTVRNMTGRTKYVKLYVWVNPFLSEKKQGLSHPAYTKLFMTDKILNAEKCVVITKNGDESDTVSLCGGFLHEEDVRIVTLNTDFFYDDDCFERCCAVGSGSGVPDPCMAFEITLSLKPGEVQKSVFFMGAGGDESESTATLLNARDEFEASNGEVLFSPCLFVREDSKRLLCEELLVPLLCPTSLSETQQRCIKCNTSGKDVLFKFGISGDNPIVTLRLCKSADLERAGVYVGIISALKRHGINVDFVMCFNEEGDYEAPLFHGAMSIIRNADELVCENLFCVNLASFTKSDETGLMAFSNVVAGEDVGKQYGNVKIFKPGRGLKTPHKPVLSTAYGDFIEDGFVVGTKTKLPWSHVLCNRTFGTLIQTGSLGFTWAFNSKENKLTTHNGFTWQRDEGEKILILMNGRYYDLIAGAAVTFKNGCGEYLVRIEKVIFKVTVFVPEKGMTKRIRVEMKNTGEKDEKIKIGYLCVPVMGSSRDFSRTLTCEVYKSGILLSGNTLSSTHGYAFFGMSDSTMDFYNTDLHSVLCGSFDSMSPMPFAENCVFVGKNLVLSENEVSCLTFSLSFGKSERSAIFFGTDYRAEIPYFKSGLCVNTGDKSLDVMINTWLPLQTVNSRIFGRTGFYQCGGAFGFRDQLQDSMNIFLIRPGLCREMIIRCSCVQFTKGDVIHWWHNYEPKEGGIRGIRTRCSDDMLWLPLALSEYVSQSGDVAFLDTQTHFIDGDELKHGENEHYGSFRRSAEKATLYEHAKRALKVGLQRGENGLIKMGNCDWNDGYSRVGINGEGTTVWGTMFYALVADRFARIAKVAGDGEFAKDLEKTANDLRECIDRVAYEDGHYLRAFFDDGTKMSGLDSLPQSFATFCRMPNRERRMSALSYAVKELYDTENGVIRLFWPPLKPTDKVAGYVNYYAPGTRENGGQYTHAAVWLAEALLKEGAVDEAYRLLCDINPINKYFTEESARRYLGEPFALAGDVYAAGRYAGRAGWTQYTGSAAWLYRILVTEMLGIHKADGILSVTPRLPAAIPSYTATYDDGKNINKIKVTR